MRLPWRRRGDVRPSRAGFVEATIPKRAVGAEIGVFRGEFTAELLELAEPRRLHLFDLWHELGPAWHWGEGDRSTTRALARIEERYAERIAAGTVAIEIGDDLETLPRFDDAYFDWVYLDSSHMYEHTRSELALLRRKVRPGGLIAGDDWLTDPEHPHHGVCRAVTELLESEPDRFELVYASEENIQWAVRLRE